jgi:hypothetical protein
VGSIYVSYDIQRSQHELDIVCGGIIRIVIGKA